jgi:SNF2 family DNA or RNA helicase
MMFGGGPGAQNSIITELFKETGAAKIKSIQKYLTKLLEELDKNFEEERAKQTAETAAQPGKPKRRLLPATFATSVDGDDIIDDDPEEAETMVKKSLIAKAPQKFLVFAHHLVVLDAVEDLMKSKGVGYIRIDGSTPAKARATSVELFARHPSTRFVSPSKREIMCF